MFALIASAMADNSEVVEFCAHEVELLDKKRGYKSSKPSKKSITIIQASIMARMRVQKL